MIASVPARFKSPRLISIVVVLITMGVSIWLISSDKQRSSAADRLDAARALLAAGDFENAERMALTIVREDAHAVQAWLIAGEAATRQRRFDDAMQHYAHVPRNDTDESITAILASAELLRTMGRLSQAESDYRLALKHSPENTLAKDRLALLLGITGRRGEAIPYLMELVRRHQCRPEHLIWLGDPQKVLVAADYLEFCRKTSPKDPYPTLGLAVIALMRCQLEESEKLFRMAVALAPNDIVVQTWLGRCLWEMQDEEQLSGWLDGLPDEARTHAVGWFLRGLVAQNREDHVGAARSFAEAASQENNWRDALYRLGRLLVLLDRPDEANLILHRAHLLQKLAVVVDSVEVERPHPDACRRAAQLTAELGRFDEANAWAALATALEPQSSLNAVLRDSMTRAALSKISNATAEFRSTLDVLRSRYPLPTTTTNKIFSPKRLQDETARNALFIDVAKASGIDFTYFEAPDPSTVGRRIFEFTGGGVGAFDYDGDRWPDLYFTQGCTWPPGGDSSHHDRLYRNSPDGRFEDVTEAARLGDTLFGQGLAVGDVNNDGFPDIYVGNVGKNPLYLNNGDGTFSNESTDWPTASWTSSCAIADVNGDGNPDIYDANYVDDKRIDSLICPTSAGPRVCSPMAFSAARDRLLLSLGNGRFEDITTRCGIDATDSYGLGVLVADLDESGSLEIFVANDMMANHLFVNEASPGALPYFADHGLMAGVAFGADGESQACMGIAADDFDGNGLLDLHVTNYFNESNSLYINESGLLFHDAAREARLRQPSFPMLGFGTQAMDADGDEDLDLVVTNGDLDDFTHEGRQFQMRPQLFWNLGDGAFEELAATARQGYFAKEFRGRGLARLDWNRDGREDFAVSNLDSPAALIENQTPTMGRCLIVNLRGVTCSRDAIGTRVTVIHGQKTQTRQLTAGDGYHASNQHQLVFWFAESSVIDTLEVAWPDGTKQTFHSVPTNQRAVIIQGCANVVLFPK